MPVEARYYEKLPDLKVQCHLCPNECVLPDNGLGECGVRLNDHGKLLAMSFGICSAIKLEPIEKKPLFHFHPGSYILSVGNIGCNFHCDFCQNAEISQATIATYPVDTYHNPEQLVEQCLNENPCLGIAFTYNEPTVWYEYMKMIALKSRESGFKNVMVTNGYINEGPLTELIPLISAFNIDLKGFSSSFYRDNCQGKLEPVKHTLKTIKAFGSHLEITFLLIPGRNDSREEFISMVKWIHDELGPDTVLHISRYFPAYKSPTEKTPIGLLFDFCEEARKYLSYVYLGNVTGSEEQNTICSKCGKMVISRYGDFVQKSGIDQYGNCMNCNNKIVSY
ncbi:MAG: AmmeMemoRadiSam system radical SAM enzyme [Cyclobacteriaceae bacterium]|nr:AmmeMemoRadiSam system radical SAM enzyme [Cyclobacteriaceae bacterium]